MRAARFLLDLVGRRFIKDRFYATFVSELAEAG
jgi:hypothetical protein